jgi:hypothetical protein
MPTFATPQPIELAADVVMGDVRVSAGARDQTVVDVRPSDASNKEDHLAAERTRVEHADGRVLIKTPKLRAWRPGPSGGSVDVTVELPEGSSVRGSGQMTDFHCAGPLGDCRIKTGLGQIDIDHATTLSLKAGAGDVAVEVATRHADIATGSGDVRVRALGDSAVIKNSNGDTWVGEVAGELRISAANGSVAVEKAHAGVAAKSANGDVRLGDAGVGSVVLETQIGDVEIGIREGLAAWLDVSATAGRVHNALEAAHAPVASGESVKVRARTAVGNVLIGRP